MQGPIVIPITGKSMKLHLFLNTLRLVIFHNESNKIVEMRHYDSKEELVEDLSNFISKEEIVNAGLL